MSVCGGVNDNTKSFYLLFNYYAEDISESSCRSVKAFSISPLKGIVTNFNELKTKYGCIFQSFALTGLAYHKVIQQPFARSIIIIML